jgi:tetratricopeptide (TPR) repeat protein
MSLEYNKNELIRSIKDKELRQRAFSIINEVFDRSEELWRYVKYPEMVDHGERHTQDVFDLLTRFLVFSQTQLLYENKSRSVEPLNDIEKFCLIFSVWFHDIGGKGLPEKDERFFFFKYARDEHACAGGERFRQIASSFNFLEEETNIIASLISAHSKKGIDISKLPEIGKVGNQPVRMWLLASLLSFVDACDTQRKRVGDENGVNTAIGEIKNLVKIKKEELENLVKIKKLLEGKEDETSRKEEYIQALSSLEKGIKELEEYLKYLKEAPEHYYKHLSVKNIFFTHESVILEKNYARKFYEIDKTSDECFKKAIEDIERELDRVQKYFKKYQIAIKEIRSYDENKDDIEELEKQLSERRKGTMIEADFCVFASLNEEFYKLTTNGKFIEDPLKEGEWKNKRRQNVIKVPQELISEALTKLKTGQILLLTGPERVGKTTFMLFFVEEILKGNLGEGEVVVFLNPLKEAEEIDDMFKRIESFIEREFPSERILFVADALRRDEETLDNFKEKSLKLFEKILTNPKFKLLCTLRSEQKIILKRYLKEKKIDLWKKFGIDEEDVSLFLMGKNFVKEIFEGYLKFEGIPINFTEFEDTMETLVQKSDRLVGWGINIIEALSRNNKPFSKETLGQYSNGKEIIWDFIQNDYYIQNDRVIPFLLLFFTKHNYSITEEFVEFLTAWLIKKFNEESLAIEVRNRIKNLVDNQTVRIEFEGIDEYRLNYRWKEAVNEILQNFAQIERHSELKKIFVDINNKYFDIIIIDFISEITNQPEIFSRVEEKWLIASDIAKIWGLKTETVVKETRLKTVAFATNFFLIGSTKEHVRTKVWKFLKRTLSLLWRRVFRDGIISLEENKQYYDLAIEFYKTSSSLDMEDYWLLWTLGDLVKIKSREEALIYYMEAAKKENTSSRYAQVIYEIEEYLKEYCRTQKLPLYLEAELLELQKEIALKSIECYAGDTRNFYTLGEILKNIGELLFEEGKFSESVRIFDKAVMAYKKSLEILKSDLIKGDEKDKLLYKSLSQSKVIETLMKKSEAYMYLAQPEEAKRCLEEAKIFTGEMGLDDEEIHHKLKWFEYYLKYDVEYNLSSILYRELSNFSEKLENVNIEECCLKKYSPLIESLKSDNIIKKIFSRTSFLMTQTIKKIKSTNAHEKFLLSREWYILGSLISESTKTKTFIFKNLHRAAAICFEISEKINHDNYAAWFKLGWECLFYLGEVEKAIIAFNKSIEVENRVKELFLFALTLSHENDIRNGKISEELRNEFKGNRSYLPKNATISALGDDKWEIPSSMGRYIIRKSNGDLLVYKESKYSHLSKIGLGKIYGLHGNISLAEKWLKDGLNACFTFYPNALQHTIDILVKTAESFKKLGELDKTYKSTSVRESLRLYETAREISREKISSKGKQTRSLETMVQLLNFHYKLIDEGETNLKPKMSLDEILNAKLTELLCIESLPERLKTLYEKEYAFTKLGEYRKGVEYADKILKINPNDVFMLIHKAQNLGNLAARCVDKFIRMKEYQKALECIDEALELDGKNIYALHNKGYYLLKLEQYDEAIACFNDCIQLRTDYAPAWYNKGYAIHKLNTKLKIKEKEIEAIKYYDEALRLLNRSPEIHREEIIATLDNKGHSLIMLGGYEEKEGNVEKAKKKWKEAIEDCFDKALELSPRFYRALNDKGQALGKLGRYAESHENLDEALKLASEEGLDKNDPEYFASILDNKGYVFSEEAKRREQKEAVNLLKNAIEFFDRAIKVYSAYTSAWQNKIYALFKLNVYCNAPKDQLISGIFNVTKEGFQKIGKKKEFLVNVRKSIIYCLVDASSNKEKYVNSKHELTSLIGNFNNFFTEFAELFKSISLDEIKSLYSKKYNKTADIQRLNEIFS